MDFHFNIHATIIQGALKFIQAPIKTCFVKVVAISAVVVVTVVSFQTVSLELLRLH